MIDGYKCVLKSLFAEFKDTLATKLHLQTDSALDNKKLTRPWASAFWHISYLYNALLNFECFPCSLITTW